MGVYVEPRGLQILSQSLDLPDDGVPLDQQSPNLLWRAPSAEALDLPAKDVPVARGLAQERIQSLVAVLQASKEVDVQLLDGTLRRRVVGSAAMPFITLRPPIYRSGSSPSRPSSAHPLARSAIAE